MLILSSLSAKLTAVTNKKIVLKVFELPDPKRTDAFNKADQAVVNAFQKKYPNIELRSFSGLKIENLDLDAATVNGNCRRCIARYNIRKL